MQDNLFHNCDIQSFIYKTCQLFVREVKGYLIVHALKVRLGLILQLSH